MVCRTCAVSMASDNLPAALVVEWAFHHQGHDTETVIVEERPS